MAVAAEWGGGRVALLVAEERWGLVSKKKSEWDIPVSARRWLVQHRWCDDAGQPCGGVGWQ